MRRYVGVGTVLVVLSILVPTASDGGVSGVFWAFTIAVLLVWLASLPPRVTPGRSGAPNRDSDSGYY